jgi:hypothetical protein
MAGHEKFDSVSKTILNGLTIIGKDITQNLVQEIISKKRDDVEDGFEEKINYLNKLYQNSIYFDGLKRIKYQMEKIRKSFGNEYRIPEGRRTASSSSSGTLCPMRGNLSSRKVLRTKASDTRLA